VLSLQQAKEVLAEAKKIGSVVSISIEGGEPFLYYPIMVKTAKEARGLGFDVEVLSNCYWATNEKDAEEWLLPLSNFENLKLTLSSDLFHGENWESSEVKNAVKAAHVLGMKVGILAVKSRDAEPPCPSVIEGVEVDMWDLMCRGRAASKLTEKVAKKPWREFTKCPFEHFENQKRVHIDPYGYVHVCQGVCIGNAWQTPLSKIIADYDPDKNPVIKLLVRGGPVALVEESGVPHEEAYVDACHLCYDSRCALRGKYPNILAPNQMYGESEN
jgi:hypothetical protein